MKKLLISTAIASMMFATSAIASSVYNHDGTVNVNGIRSTSLHADSQNLPPVEYSSAYPIPGQVKSFKKSFVTAPPMIPHRVSNMLPITLHNNQCLSCHMPQYAKKLGVPSIPADHFKDSFEGGTHHYRISGSRFNCTQCHAPQAKVKLAIQNHFNEVKAKRGF